MNNSIGMEIVRLVKEISNDEIELMHAQRQLDTSNSEAYINKYTKEVKRYKESLERKMALLVILKG